MITAHHRGRSGIVVQFVELAQRKVALRSYSGVAAVVAVAVARVEGLGSVADQYRLVSAAVCSAHFQRSLCGDLDSTFRFQVHSAARDLRPLYNFGPPVFCVLCSGLHLSEQYLRILE